MSKRIDLARQLDLDDCVAVANELRGRGLVSLIEGWPPLDDAARRAREYIDNARFYEGVVRAMLNWLDRSDLMTQAMTGWRHGVARPVWWAPVWVAVAATAIDSARRGDEPDAPAPTPGGHLGTGRFNHSWPHNARAHLVRCVVRTLEDDPAAQEAVLAAHALGGPSAVVEIFIPRPT